MVEITAVACQPSVDALLHRMRNPRRCIGEPAVRDTPAMRLDIQIPTDENREKWLACSRACSRKRNAAIPKPRRAARGAEHGYT